MKFLLPKEPAFGENFKEMSACMSEITDLFKGFVVNF
jgi:hypothetical protein